MRRAAGGGGNISFYKSTDGGEHWALATDDPRVYETGSTGAIRQIPGRWAASAAATCPPLRWIPKNEKVVYSCSTVFWRTEDGGLTWSAVRGAPGGDDYQKSWVNPNNTNIILLVSDQGGVVSANRGESWSNWYNQPTAAMYHVTADNAFPYRLCSGQQDSGSACVESRSMDGEITFHDWHPVDIEEYGEAAPDPKNPDLVYGGKVSVYNRLTGQKANVGPAAAAGTWRGWRVLHANANGPRRAPFARSRSSGRPKIRTFCSTPPPVCGRPPTAAIAGLPISGDLTRQTWDIPAMPASTRPR